MHDSRLGVQQLHAVAGGLSIVALHCTALQHACPCAYAATYRSVPCCGRGAEEAAWEAR
jgi:hypothetical protein